jgi:peptidoglycan/xylan/chitin deacetylase (PgdA/CDA1 family)
MHRLLSVSLLVASILCVGCGPKAEAWLNAPGEQASSSASSSKTAAAAASKHRLLRRSAASAEARKTLTPIKNLPILVYHHVRPDAGWSRDSWNYKMSITPEAFEKQMKWLAEHGYVSVKMDAAAALLKGELDWPPKPVVITFDDNNLSQYDVAAPIMEKYGLIGVFYQVTDRLDTPGTLDREKTLDLLKRGHDIQSHTLSHRALTGLSPDEAERDMRESRLKLEEILGRPVLHLAYPGTAHNQAVRERAKAAGYVTATIMDPRRALPTDDFFKLPRIMMIDTTDVAKVLP